MVIKKLEHATGVDTSDLATKKDSVALKSEVDKLMILINWLMFQLFWIIQKQK